MQIKVTAEGHGAACHTGRRSCFYRKIVNGELEFIDDEKLLIRISFTGNSSPSLPFSSCPHSMRASQRLKEDGRVEHGMMRDVDKAR